MRSGLGRSLAARWTGLLLMALTPAAPFSPAHANLAPPSLAPWAGTWAAQQDYVIGAYDLLDVRVFGEPELGGKHRVSAQGNIRIAFVGEIKASGFTESQLADVVRDKLKAQLKDPQVSIFVEEHRNQLVTIFGFVRTPGRYELPAGSQLVDLLGMAGGLLENAGETAVIVRAASMHDDDSSNGEETSHVSLGVELVDLRKLMAGDRRANAPLYPGDVVTIAQAEKVFVSGNVNTPGVFDLRGKLTLSQVVAMAGGLKPASKKSEVVIVRQDADKARKVQLVVDLGRMEKHPEEDLVLQASDIVWVPPSAAKSFGLSLLNALGMQSALLPLYMIRR